MRKQLFCLIIFIFIVIFQVSAFDQFIPAQDLGGELPKFSTYYKRKFADFSSGFSDLGVSFHYPNIGKIFSVGLDFNRFGSEKYYIMEPNILLGIKPIKYITLGGSFGLISRGFQDLNFAEEEPLPNKNVLAFNAGLSCALNINNRLKLAFGSSYINKPDLSLLESAEIMPVKLNSNIEVYISRKFSLVGSFLRENNNNYFGIKLKFNFPSDVLSNEIEITSENKITPYLSVNTFNYWDFKFGYDLHYDEDLQGNDYYLYISKKFCSFANPPKIIFNKEKWSKDNLKLYDTDQKIKFSVRGQERLKKVAVSLNNKILQKVFSIRNYENKNYSIDLPLKQGENDLQIEIVGINGKKIIKDKIINCSKDIVSGFPPDLYIKNLEFIESSGNNALDGLEEGYLKFEIYNKGRGNAEDISVNVTPLSSSKHINYKAKLKIDSIPSKQDKKVLIPISADFNVSNLEREFRIDVTESRGFDAKPLSLKFETQRYRAPDLKIEKVAIDDNEDEEGEGYSYGNGNSIIEPNESIEVTAFVQNFGRGDANNVKAKVLLNSNNPNISSPDKNRTFNLGNIASGDYKPVKFYFYTSRRYDKKDIPLSIKVEEKTKKFGKTIDLGLKLKKKTKNILNVAISKIETKEKTEIREIAGVIDSVDVDINIPNSTTKGENTLAVIIGIEDYKYAPGAEFAGRDAQIFYKYARYLFNIPERNIFYRINENATSGEFNKIFSKNGWLARRLTPDKTNIIIFYSGHGSPDPKSKKGYLIPYDIDPNYANTGISLNNIYTSLSELSAKSVTMFIDACFSGESRSQEMLVAGTRPINIKIKNPVFEKENMAVFTAATGEQYSSSYPQKKHGLFTYFLLKGLGGKAKGDDNKLSLNELYKYVYKKVEKKAGYLDKEQNPTLIGKNKDRLIIIF